MGTSNAVKLIDIALAALTVATESQAIIMRARSENRDVSDAEIQTIVDENKMKRAAWDAAGEGS